MMMSPSSRAGSETQNTKYLRSHVKPANAFGALGSRASLLGVADAAARTLLQIRHLIDCLLSVPREVYELRDSIAGFRQLLEIALQSGAGENLLSNNEHGHATALHGLYQELASAKNTLSQLEGLLGYVQIPNTLGDVHGSPPDVFSQASVKTRWSIQRKGAVKLLADINDGRQRVFARLVALNLNISTDVFYTIDDQNPRQDEELATRRLDSKYRDVLQGIDRIDDHVLRSQNSNGVTPHRTMITPENVRMMPRPGTESEPSEGHQLVIRKRPGTASSPHQHAETQIQRRDLHNEPKFQHMERVFSTITSILSPQEPDPGTALAPSTSGRHSPVQPLTSHFGQISQGTCSLSCKCRCHLFRSTTVASWGLSAFQSTIGSFAFIFTNKLGSRMPCNVPSCIKGNGGKWSQVTYVFPSWLFHAAVSATFTNLNGPPELVLRVLRRIDANHYGGIFSCIAHGETENVKRMLQRKEASVLDVKQENGLSTLAGAYRWRRYDIVEVLLQEGADIFQMDDSGLSPCHLAVQTLFTADYLPSSFRSRLWNTLPLDDMMEHCALTDLHKVVMGIRCIDVREYLCLRPRNADINAGDISGQTPLFYASARGDADAVEALLDAGALVDAAKSQAAERPLHIACQNGHFDVVDKLIDAGADIHARALSCTPLHQACMNPYVDQKQGAANSIKIAAKLLDHGADVNSEKSAKTTPLDLACSTSPVALVKFLIERGADPCHRDWEGTNALGNAIAHDRLDNAAFLLQYESVCRNVDDNGLDLMHYLGLCASVEMMELFMDAPLPSGLSTSAKDINGMTALQLCNQRADATDKMKDTFVRLLERISRMNEWADDSSDGDSASDYLDAPEG